MARHLRRGIMLGQLLLIALVMALVVPASDPAGAAAADILVADLDAGDVSSRPGRIFRLSDAGSEVGGYSSSTFVEPSGITLDPKTGDILVADPQAFKVPGSPADCPGGDPGPGCPGGIIRLNAVTGVQTAAYSGAPFVEPTGVVVTSTGDILVADQDAYGAGCIDPENKSGCGAIIKVDSAGNKTRFDNGAAGFWNPTGIAIDPRNGDVLVADLDAPVSEGNGKIFRLSSAGVPIAEYTIPGSVEPSGIAVDSAGDMFVADAVAFQEHGGVFRLNAAGQKTREYFGGAFDEPTGIALAWNGDLLVADQDAGGPFEVGPGAVIRVNRDTAAQTTYMVGSFVNPTAVVVEPGTPPNAPPPPPAGASKCRNRTVTLSGTDAKETLKGTPVRDVISALGGNDTIRAREGNDLVCAGRGKDKVDGGKGKDRLFGEAGNDRLIGGPGADRLVGGKGRDVCIGGPGTDTASGCEVKLEIP